MTNEQLEKRVIELERQVAELRRNQKSFAPFRNMEETFGIFANDPEFDEIVRLGREYRQKVNAEEL